MASNLIRIKQLDQVQLSGFVAEAGLSAAGPSGNVFYNAGGQLSGASGIFYNSQNNRVGIATSSPSSTLHVNGNVSVTGSVTTSSVGIFGGSIAIGPSGARPNTEFNPVGLPGEIRYAKTGDAWFLYINVGDTEWKQVPLDEFVG